MILPFKNQFKEKILNGSKIHTIREDKKLRWKTGRKIHFVTGSRTPNQETFKEGLCYNVQPIVIDPTTKKIHMVTEDLKTVILEGDKIETFAKNDGFDMLEDFWKWFSTIFRGVVIHWTDFEYKPFEL